MKKERATEIRGGVCLPNLPDPLLLLLLLPPPPPPRREGREGGR